MQKVTPEKVEQMQAVILQLRCVISNWKCIGQGDGGLMNEPYAEEKALDDQKTFIEGKYFFPFL